MKRFIGLAVAGLTVSAAAYDAKADAVLPDFDAGSFTPGTAIDSPFFPLIRGSLLTYQASDGTIEDTFVTSQTKNILGVATTVVRERAFEDDLLIEESINYFAQDQAGNVWYFGEDSTQFERDDQGHLLGTNTEGSWRAGSGGAKPGILMEGDPQVGDDFFQEFAPGIAEDQARIAALHDSLTIGLGPFSGLVRTVEFDPIGGDYEAKYYAPGVGVIFIRDGVNADGSGTPEKTLELVGIQTIVPEPSSLGLLAVGALLAFRRPRRV